MNLACSVSDVKNFKNFKKDLISLKGKVTRSFYLLVHFLNGHKGHGRLELGASAGPLTGVQEHWDVGHSAWFRLALAETWTGVEQLELEPTPCGMLALQVVV